MKGSGHRKKAGLCTVPLVLILSVTLAGCSITPSAGGSAGGSRTVSRSGSAAGSAAGTVSAEEAAAAATESTQAAADTADESESAASGSTSDTPTGTVSYLLTTADTMDETLAANPLNASRTYKGTTAAVVGTITDISSDGTFLLLGPLDSSSDGQSITCMIRSEEQVEEAAALCIGDALTVCGTVTDVSEDSGYTLDISAFEGSIGTQTDSRYEDYTEIHPDELLAIDLPSVWTDETQPHYLVVDRDYRILQLLHLAGEDSVSYVVQLMVIDLGEEIGDLSDREEDLKSYFSGDIEASDVQYDTVGDIQRARVIASSDSELNLTDFYAQEDGTRLYCLTIDDWSGDSAQAAENAEYFENASGSIREAGTVFNASRDYTGWNRVQLSDQYSILIPGGWDRISESEISWSDPVDGAWAIRRDDSGSILDAMVVQQWDLTESVQANTDMAGRTLQEYLQEMYTSDRSVVESFASGIIGSSAESGQPAPTKVSCDTVNGYFRIKIERDPAAGSIKRTDAAIDGNTVIVFDYNSFDTDYETSIGVFTKCVRSLDIPEAAIMRRRSSGEAEEEEASSAAASEEETETAADTGTDTQEEVSGQVSVSVPAADTAAADTAASDTAEEPADTAQTAEQAPASASITLDQYNQVTEGMTYEQVVGIFGSGGTPQTDADPNDTISRRYLWSGERTGAVAIIDFENGLVASKAQFGLE